MGAFLMPTLAASINSKLRAAGLSASDVSAVLWDTGNPRWGDAGFVPVDRSQFVSVASTVQVSDIPDANRERMLFHIVTGAGVVKFARWDAGQSDFIVEDPPPRIVVLTADDLTT